MRRRSMSRRALAAAAALVCLLSAGCVRLPDNGPVRVGNEPDESQLDDGFRFDPRPPQRGESATEIVQHFLDAMTANPIQTSTARQFLAESAAASWSPGRRMITYAFSSTPSGAGRVHVNLTDAHWLNARGVWQGALPPAQSRLDLPMVIQDGEWRIGDVPDAMIVSENWFQARYRQVSLYFFDQAAEILVPEPVFVPRGSQQVTSLVHGLLSGPPEELRGNSPSFFPRDSALADVSVPVSRAGVAEVSLRGDLGSMNPESLELMTAQIAWTLRQDPTVSKFRVSIGDTPVTLAGGETEFSVNLGDRFDPAGSNTWPGLFGLRNGRLVSATDGVVRPVAGRFGRTAYGLRDVSVDLSGKTVAGVGTKGSSLFLSSVDDEGDNVTTLVSGATDLAHPAWDAAGRLWVLDRRSQGAVVSVVISGRRRALGVPGISGRKVTDFLVSRDGSRMVAAIDRPEGDVVVISRLVPTGDGIRATRARVIENGGGKQLQIRDLGWRSPTETLVLNSLTRRLSEIRTVSVDGSPTTGRGNSPTELLRGNARALVSAPVSGLAAWVLFADGQLVELAPVEGTTAPAEDVDALTHVG
jgi:hypothetical protein